MKKLLFVFILFISFKANTQTDSASWKSITGKGFGHNYKCVYQDTNSLLSRYIKADTTLPKRPNKVRFSITDEYLEAIIEELERHGYYLLKVGGSATNLTTSQFIDNSKNKQY